ncbi:MAG TPA: GH92 family glycosyl hydrolase [Chitinophagaceae bacterium]|nr:GH92 family glycosyl hydrolase [Chitinophagaceae bacterium]
MMRPLTALYSLWILFSCLLPGAVQAQSAPALPAEAASNIRFVDPTIGNVGHLLQPTRPTVHLPNQMMRMYPVRKDYIDDQISSFPGIVLSHRLGEAFALMPSVRPLTAAAWKQPATYDHDLEVTRPYYYSTYLIDEDITVEFVPGRKGGIYRFRFPRSAGPKSLLFQPYNKGRGSFTLKAGSEIEATETYQGDIKVYLYGVLSRKGTPVALKEENVLQGTVPESAGLRTGVSFPEATGDVEFRYAVSYISPEQARANYHAELAQTGFEALKGRGLAAWKKVMDQVRTEGGTPAQKRSFYTALYRCYERMVDITENGRYFSGFDRKVHTTNRPFYVDDWTWDSYLAHHPLRSILDPSGEEDMLQSFVEMYRQSGWMPTFPVLFGDHACMNGFHSSVVFLDAYRKGLRRFDVQQAYAGMKKNADEATMIPWRNGPKADLDVFYHQKGYFPALQKEEKETNRTVDPFENRQSVAVTLGAAYDDWAVGQLARELGIEDDYKRFQERASNYRNVWNPQAGFFYPKDEKGAWVSIDPKFDGGMGGRAYYDENNGWTYLWQVQHDVPGLVGLMGGTRAFEERLDQLFREDLGRSKYEFNAKFPDATGLVGQFSMGNEPSFHIPYLYNVTDAPWKTQKRVRFLLDLWFDDSVFGIPGDEDGGGMTAFVVFSSMGFYPVTPGLPVYTIGSPVFSKISVQLPNGKQFRVTAQHNSRVNKYIQRARLNGQPLDTPWFTHEQLLAGGHLELEMGPKPNKQWGRGSAAPLTEAVPRP